MDFQIQGLYFAYEVKRYCPTLQHSDVQVSDRFLFLWKKQDNYWPNLHFDGEIIVVTKSVSMDEKDLMDLSFSIKLFTDTLAFY
jgi:hypothetical protein